MEEQKIAKIITQLHRHVGARKKVRIGRVFSNNDYMNGFIHDISEQLLVIQQFYDFSCEGYSIVRLSDISYFRSDEHERFFEKILKAEGIIDQVEFKKNVPISDITTALSWFSECGKNIIIECESSESVDDEYHIGKVIEIDEEDVWFVGFNAIGEWDREEIALKSNEITRIQFDTPYIDIFSKYLKER